MKDKSIVINNLWFYRFFNGMFTGGNKRFIRYVIPDDILESMYENVEYQEELKIKVLDIGCGDGKNLLYMRDKYFHAFKNSILVGTDASIKLIERARKKYKKEIRDENIFFYIETIDNLLCESSSIDYVLSSFTFHHLPPEIKKAGIKEIYRVLKPGGYLMYIDHGKPHNVWTWFITNLITRHCEHIGTQVNNEVLELMKEEGFKVERHIKNTVFNGNVDCILARKNEI